MMNDYTEPNKLAGQIADEYKNMAYEIAMDVEAREYTDPYAVRMIMINAAIRYSELAEFWSEIDLMLFDRAIEQGEENDESSTSEPFDDQTWFI